MLRAAVMLVLVSCALVGAVPPSLRSHPPGGNLTVPELIEQQGYPVEIHHVTTQDGYILEMHRIPHGINQEPSTGRPVAFLNHCLLCCSSDWIMNTPDRAFAYMMADAGYDVWMSNLRGNTYSRKHVSLNADEDFAFWDFSWHQMGMFDLPAMIDYTLQTTGQPDLYFVGYSMGTTTFFAMMSEMPEYNDKIRVMIGMAPVVYMNHMKSPLAQIVPQWQALDLILTERGKGEYWPSRDITDRIMEKYCDEDAFLAPICYDVLFLLTGPDLELLNKEYLPLILTQTPAGTSFHTVTHYTQLVNDTEFRMYDYGEAGNDLQYGQSTAPIYNLDNVKVPVAIFWGENDWVVVPEDVAKLVANLPNVIFNQRVNHSSFNHLDFVWAYNADELVYRQVMEVLAQY